MTETNLTAQNFMDEVANSDKPVMVDLWAEWCGPCRMLSPVISEIAKEHEEQVKVCKVNVDEEPGLAATFKIASIPTVLVFQKGEIISRKVGVQSKKELLAAI